MSDLFTKTPQKPLAERMRPKELSEYIGQEHLIGEGKPISQMIRTKQLSSMIFWGPPGVGKTTLAFLISKGTDLPFYSLSAIQSGVKEVREIIQKAKRIGRVLLFIDEIHRFNKSQQDSLLGAVEQGFITLIGATTENPSFEVIRALLSRCMVFVLKPLELKSLTSILKQAIANDKILQQRKINLKETEALLKWSGGDARKLLNIFEMLVVRDNKPTLTITNTLVEENAAELMAVYDKTGEQHYDLISAFIKSIRGSDPNAALFWLAQMIEGGEDPKFIARRLLILASEDIGNANPTALVIANNGFAAVERIGYPECEIILSQVVTYLATSAKSNASYMAIKEARRFVKDVGNVSVPLHLRNAPTKLMKELDYGKDYLYPHNYKHGFVAQNYFPEEHSPQTFYHPANNAKENQIRERMKKMWEGKYEY